MKESRRPRRPPPSSGETARAAVEEILEQDRARREAEQQRPAPGGSGTTGGRLLAVLVLTALTVWIWVAPPSFVRPPPLPEPTPVQIETGLRMDMYVAALSVERYRSEHGRLPDALADALEDPVDGEDIAYEAFPDGSFRLTGVRGDTEAVWRSTEPLRNLVDEARARVDGGGPP